MIFAVAAETKAQAAGGMRALDAPRDLGAVARLIEHAFAGELDQRAQSALREMRWMARLSPLVWWWAQADPEFREAYRGFVWEEPDPRTGRPAIVGNVSLNRAPGNRTCWIVCNVAVRPEYRRQGIARRLTQAALLEASELGAERVVLQAFEDNVAAMRLYTDLGFRVEGGESELRLPAVQPVSLHEAPGYELRAWQPARWKAAYELARRAVAPAQQWLQPIREADYRLDAWLRLQRWLGDRLAGRRVMRLAAWHADELVALLTLSAATREGVHHLRLLAHPDHWGKVEPALISRALRALAPLPPRAVWATVDRDHRAAVEELRQLGFREQRTLLTLKKDLR